MTCKAAEPIAPKFCVGPHMTPGKVYGCSKLQKFVSKVFDFCKSLKMREQIWVNPRNFFIVNFYTFTFQREYASR